MVPDTPGTGTKYMDDFTSDFQLFRLNARAVWNGLVLTDTQRSVRNANTMLPIQRIASFPVSWSDAGIKRSNGSEISNVAYTLIASAKMALL